MKNGSAEQDLEMSEAVSSADIEPSVVSSSPHQRRHSGQQDQKVADWAKTTDIQTQNAAALWARKVTLEQEFPSVPGSSRVLNFGPEGGRDPAPKPLGATTDSRSKASSVTQKMSLGSTPPAHFPEAILTKERKKWDDLEARLFGGPAGNTGNQYPMVLIRNYVLWANETIPSWKRRVDGLRRPQFSLRSLRLYAGVEGVSSLLAKVQSRVDPFVTKVMSYPLENWEDNASPQDTDEYIWLSEVCYEIEQGIDTLETIVMQIQLFESERQQQPGYQPSRGLSFTPIPGSAREGSTGDDGISRDEESSRPPTPTAGISSNANTRGAAETTNSRARQWQISSHRRPIPIDRGIQRQGVGEAGVGGMSTLSSYKATFGTLGAIAFFGASVSWGSVFSGTRGDLALLAWSSAVFAVATVAAGGMAIVVESDHINMERDMIPRRAVRALAVISGVLIFSGIMLLSTAVLDLDRSDVPLGSAKKTWIRASGIFTMAASVIVVIIAIFVRFKYATGSQRW